MSQFIYLVTNTINNKQYVGQTNRTVNIRWIEHLNRARNNRGSSYLTKAIKECGSDVFKVETIAEFNNLSIEELHNKEIEFIDKYNCLYPNGYNKSPGGKLGAIRKISSSGRISYLRSRWEDEDYKQVMINKTLVKARRKGHTLEANRKRSETTVNNRRYLITDPNGIQFCTKGLSHLKESHGLDPSCLIKCAKGILIKHNGYKCESINGYHESIKRLYLEHHGKYECISLTKDNYSFCSYGIDAIKEQLKLDICQKTISHHINNANLINSYQIRDINAEPIIKQYLPDVERFIFTTPEGISFCRYGMEDLTEETGLNPKAIYQLMNPNNRNYGSKHKGWNCVRANESEETRDKLLADKAAKLAEDKLINDAKKSWNFVRNKRYLLTNLITNEQLCCYGLVHLRESHGLDGSCLIKVIKGKIKHHKNWTCIKIEDN